MIFYLIFKELNLISKAPYYGDFDYII